MKVAIFALMAATQADSCESTDTQQRQAQEVILQEGNSKVGMPSIRNFRERKLMKDILEMRDQSGLVTYTYIASDMRGCLIFLGDTIGYPIPYATQFTNPEKQIGNYQTMPQADPNGLFSPDSAEGSWVMMKSPEGTQVSPVYVEPRVVTLPFKAPESVICAE